MNKGLFTLVATTLLAAAIASPATAAVKSGTACSQVNQRTNQAGYTYTCINSGKKLVWSKGVLINKPSTQMAGSTKIPTPVPSIFPINKPETPNPVLSPASDYQSVQSCELSSSVPGGNLGFLRDPSWTKSSEVLNIGVIYASYTDAGINPKAISEYESNQEPNAQAFYSATSYGKLKINFVSSHKIYQIKTSTTSYNLKSQNANFTGLVTDVMNVAKSDYDFSKIDEILVVMPDKTVTNDLGSAGIQANIDGKIFTESIEGAYSNPSDSNLIHPDWLTHEIGHTFGLIHPNLSGQFNQLSNGLFDAYAWDIMSWDLVPDPGFYAWEKFILGWITPDQVACLTSPPAQPITTYLSAVELPSADTKMLVLRISASQALVIESHRKDEVDPLSSSQEGVLVYKLDVSKGSNEGAISVLYNKPKVSQSNAKFLYGTLSEGDSVMSDGLTITVLKHANGGDYVSISKS